VLFTSFLSVILICLDCLKSAVPEVLPSLQIILMLMWWLCFWLWAILGREGS